MSDVTQKLGCAGYQGKEALEQLMQDAEKPILVKVVAPHCPACETLAPVLEQLVAENLGKINLVTIDMTEEPELAVEFKVRSAPTVVLCKGHEVQDRIDGLKPKKRYAEAIQKVI